jgi:threonyl-tRNA synthetase
MSTTMLRTAFTTCAVKGARTKASMRNGAKCASSSGSSSSSSMRLLSSASDGRGRRAQTRAAGEKVDAAPVVALPTSDESENLLKIRHTSAHVMAMAVQKVFPSAQCTIGPWIERGFYYDFYYPEGFTNQDMKNIQKEMYKIIRKDYPLRREEVSREEAERRIRAINEPYKLEILDSIKTEPITIYHIGDEWWDLCAGPHVESTGKLDQKAFELESVAGAYWRGDETKPMLQRIYGTAWETPEQLQAYNDFKAEAARRDHRKIGKDLNLFSLQQDNAGGGLVFWHPKGAHMRHMIETYWKDLHLARGYELLYSPHVAKQELWQTSGHSDFYSENMYQPIKVEDEMYQLKPMNCPFHIVVYQDGYYSYRDLPIRWAELGTVYRYERSGTMHGLFRVRGFTQDDAHIFCLPDQITDEIKGVLDLTEEILSTFGFTNFEVNLSTRPEKSVGDDEIWIKAESALKDALDRKKWNYIVDDGGGAFYGPKIDIKILDAIGRKWQCSTVQLDFNLPERFKLNYVDKENEKQRPIMIHRAIFGSLERFFGILTENYAGEFPLWLAPTQVRLLPVTDTVSDFTESVAKKLRDAGVRVEICTGERLNKLVRNAEKAKIPVMAVVGKDEAENNTLAVRTYKDGDIGSLSVDDVLARIVTANATKGADF